MGMMKITRRYDVDDDDDDDDDDGDDDGDDEGRSISFLDDTNKFLEHGKLEAIGSKWSFLFGESSITHSFLPGRQNPAPVIHCLRSNVRPASSATGRWHGHGRS